MFNRHLQWMSGTASGFASKGASERQPGSIGDKQRRRGKELAKKKDREIAKGAEKREGRGRAPIRLAAMVTVEGGTSDELANTGTCV